MLSGPTLHFVYNVDGTPAALLRDFLHRLRDPDSYPCRLCDITYGRFLKKAEWRAFVARLPVRTRFHLRAGFRRRFPDRANEKLPAIFVERLSGTVVTLVSRDELSQVADLESLEELVAKRIDGLPV